MLSFENDYSEGAHPRILARLAETNLEQLPGYETDTYCASAQKKFVQPAKSRKHRYISWWAARRPMRS